MNCNGLGLALFYGGMVRRKNVLSSMMHSFVVMSIVGVLWIIIGYSLAGRVLDQLTTFK